MPIFLQKFDIRRGLHEPFMVTYTYNSIFWQVRLFNMFLLHLSLSLSLFTSQTNEKYRHIASRGISAKANKTLT